MKLRHCSTTTTVALTMVALLIAVPMYLNIRTLWIFGVSLMHYDESENQALTSLLSNGLSLGRDKNNTTTLLQLSESNNKSNTIMDVASLLPPPILATDISNAVHDMLAEATNAAGIKLSNLSSVDYRACCGLGHRLARMANAAWVAKRLDISLRTYWGFCGADTEIFQHLFGVPTAQDLANVTSTNHHIMYTNDVSGFQALVRRGQKENTTSFCACHHEQIEAHREFYEDLQRRFRYKTYIDAFVQSTFDNHTVLGMHVRAGNGERGDFANKGRGIEHVDVWVKQASMRIREQLSTFRRNEKRRAKESFSGRQEEE